MGVLAFVGGPLSFDPSASLRAGRPFGRPFDRPLGGRSPSLGGRSPSTALRMSGRGAGVRRMSGRGAGRAQDERSGCRVCGTS